MYSLANRHVNAKTIKPGISMRPNKGIKFPINLDLALSLHFPAITTISSHKAKHATGKGAMSPGGIHFVLSEFSTFPSTHSFRVGMQDSSNSSGT